jgi:parvulin-like peptidyl-prolyl isomerase
MLPEFEKACYENKIGDISQPVRTQYGYHIIQVKNREAVAFEDVKEEVANTMREKKVTAYVDDLRKKSDAKLDESFFGAAPKPGLPAFPGGPATPAGPAGPNPPAAQ